MTDATVRRDLNAPPANATHVSHIDADPFTSRRRFLILSLMAGWIKPERVTERIVAEITEEST